MDNIFPSDSQEQIKTLIRHFVPLTWIELAIEGSQVVPRAASGFVIAIGEQWAWLTAGHVIRDIEQADKRGFAVKQLRLYDLCNSYQLPADDEGIPVEFELGRWFSVYEDTDDDPFSSKKAGLDYGGVLLTNHDQLAMKQVGVVPLDESYWCHLPDASPEGMSCIVLGIPDATSQMKVTRRAGGLYKVDASVTPVIAPFRIGNRSQCQKAAILTQKRRLEEPKSTFSDGFHGLTRIICSKTAIRCERLPELSLGLFRR